MSTFVLVHGSFHGGWCWDAVAERLAGHRVVAVELPGRAGDPRPLGSLGLADYAARVAETVAAEPDPVVLVGHSMGGVVVTQAAERAADRVARLVYVCAYLPQNGQSLLDLAKTDAESVLMRNLVIDETRGVHHVRPEGARESFYHDCSDEDAARATARLVPEPLAVVATPVATTRDRFGRIPRTYIECTDDRAVGPSLQRRMHAAQPCRVVTMPSSHSPFFSRPEDLARAIVG
ncbi:MAG TPA: alpha/beta fold hydrolase [Polyangia bacterium]